jgi:glycine cleavage system H protein
LIPEDLRYTAEHEWVRSVDEGRVRIGITHYAQDALGDVVFVSLPEAGASVSAGEAFGEVVARNEALQSRPELVNSDPYGEGWIVEIAPADPAALDGLLDAAAYEQLTTSS